MQGARGKYKENFESKNRGWENKILSKLFVKQFRICYINFKVIKRDLISIYTCILLLLSASSIRIDYKVYKAEAQGKFLI
jgi:hypothetical protein